MCKFKLKKIFIFSAILSFSPFIFSQSVPDFTSQAFQNQQISEQNQQSSTENSSSSKTKKVKLTKEQKAAAKQAQKLAKEQEKQRQKLLKKQKKDKYTGWIYIPESKFTITNGDVKIYMNGKTGCFELYAVPENLKAVPLLATYDSFSSSYFSVRIGNKVYRLNRENGVKSEARRTPYGAQMAYTISGKAQIVVDFSFLPSIASSSRVDMLRVTIYTINLSKHIQSFAIKGVFDTQLGENTLSHFSTASERNINTERQFLDMKDQIWVRSENEKAAIQFLLNGKGISNPQVVTMANKDVLENSSWIPQAQEGKSFSSVISYNNSALSVNWKTAYLDPMKLDIITFYISVASDGNEPAGKKFLASLAEGKTVLSANLPDVVSTTTVAPLPEKLDESQIKTPYWENMPVVPESSSQSQDGLFTFSDFDSNQTQTLGFDDETSNLTSENFSSNSNDDLLDYQNVLSQNPQNQPQQNQQTQSSLSQNQQNQQTQTSPQQNQNVPHEVSPEQVKNDPQLDPSYIQNILDRIEQLENDPELVNEEEIQNLNKELDEIFSKLRSLE